MYIIELFSERADQVKLITFLLSALLAVVVLLLNQCFINRRARKEFLTSKIEDLYQLTIDYTETCTRILDDIKIQCKDKNIKYPEVKNEEKRKIRSIIRKMEMIFGLYFPNSGFDPNQYFLWNMEVLEHLEKGKFAEDGILHLMFQDADQHIIDSDAKLAVICSELTNKYGHGTIR